MMLQKKIARIAPHCGTSPEVSGDTGLNCGACLPKSSAPTRTTRVMAATSGLLRSVQPRVA